jgi:hypothetical protein
MHQMAMGDSVLRLDSVQRKEKTDSGAHLSAAETAATAYPFGHGANWATGHFLAWADTVPRGLFYIFFNQNDFSFSVLKQI